MKKIFLAFTIVSLQSALAFVAHADLLKDFDSLGGNDVLLDKAQALSPDAQISAVQERLVDRRWRVELAPEFSGVWGGNPYNSTQNLGFNAYLHIIPQLALGVKYNYAVNSLTPEGQQMIQDTSVTGSGVIPEIDYPKHLYMAMINYFPFYGKLKLTERGVVHFDAYGMAGYGSAQLRSGQSGVMTAGGGLGIWWSQYLTSRLEARWQTYDTIGYRGTKKEDMVIGSLQLGVLL